MAYLRDEIGKVSRDELERAYFQAIEDRDFLKKRVDELMKTIAWIHGLMRSKFPPREKVYLYGINCEEKENEPEKDGLYRMPRAKLADKYGLSESQVGDCGKGLKEKGIIKKRTDHRTSEKTGKIEKLSFVALGDSIRKNPKAVDFSSEKNWGGKRIKACANCGNTEFTVHTKKRCACTQCGQVEEEEKWTTLNEGNNTENNSEMENNN